MLEIIVEMLSYSFLKRAIIVGSLVSVCAAVLGVILVLKRYSMIGDGLSHVSFGVMAMALALGLEPLLATIPVLVLIAFLLLRLNHNSNLKGDAIIGLLSVSFLAMGVMTISLTTGMNTDIYNYMFGSILSMSKLDVKLSLILSSFILVVYVFYYNEIFAVTFDEDFARATGINVDLYNMLIASLTAVTIVLGMRIMGAMLISSLIIFPALTSMKLFSKFKSVVLSSIVVSLVSFFIGIILSYVYSLPSGASIVIVNLGIYIIFSLLGIFSRKS